ncbi:hypothetical protein [Devosia neptuniae]|uniref:hypothetical protein n=1 Tax=Devosia neptuniae TaxID=191302 RepID=UPI0022B05AC1|nr:hypothetical protein [Devosia neptuniae]MCZ4344502.1 hypothetical protein [Devosia neptuniae]|tara:strand:- start:36370 stop:36705 length:336 start_codon:yes stop_codon:yes gene_type:complete
MSVSSDGLPKRTPPIAGLPGYYTPAQIAEHFQISERTVRDHARRLGCYRGIGSRIMFLLDVDLQVLLDFWRGEPRGSVVSAYGRLSNEAASARARDKLFGPEAAVTKTRKL